MICKFFIMTFLFSKITDAEISDAQQRNTEYNISPRLEGTTESYVPNTTPLYWYQGIVPYYIDPLTYDDIISRRVHIAMNTIARASCVMFRPLPAKPTGGNGSWLHFTNPTQQRECVHEPIFGMDDEVIIILGFECMQSRDVLHSLLHALGFKDEVSHPHRDQYIRVLWENVQPKYRTLFRIQYNGMPSKTPVEYDPMSLMHFHDRAYSSNGAATIAPLIPGLTISPSDTLSQLDRMKLRLYFGHECNKRKVDNLLDTCKTALYDGDGVKANDNEADVIEDYRGSAESDSDDMPDGNDTPVGNNVSDGNNTSEGNNMSDGNNTPEGNNMSDGNDKPESNNMSDSNDTAGGNNMTDGYDTPEGNNMSEGNYTSDGNNMPDGNDTSEDNNMSDGNDTPEGNNISDGNDTPESNNMSDGNDTPEGNNVSDGNESNQGHDDEKPAISEESRGDREPNVDATNISEYANGVIQDLRKKQ